MRKPKEVDFVLLEDKIHYRAGYKYQLRRDASIRIKLNFIKPLDIPFITYVNGILTAKFGYAWDGPSGPAIDTKNFMRSSLFHDVLYQLIREGYISTDYYDLADSLLYYICKIDKMFIFRRTYVYGGVNIFGPEWNKYTHSVVTAP